MRARAPIPTLVSPTTNPISILWDARNSVSVYPLLTSSETSYVYNVTEGSTLTEEGDPDRDPDATGVQNLAAIGVKSVRGDDGDYFNASVLAIGSPFLFDGYFTGASTFGNGAYVTDLAKYVTGTTGSLDGRVQHAQAAGHERHRHVRLADHGARPAGVHHPHSAGVRDFRYRRV